MTGQQVRVLTKVGVVVVCGAVKAMLRERVMCGGGSGAVCCVLCAEGVTNARGDCFVLPARPLTYVRTEKYPANP